MNAAAAAALLITAVSTILIAASPAPATAAADDAKFSLWPYRHVHIINELGSSQQMMVHCKGKRFLSKTEDLGVHYVGDGSEYTWRFKPGFFGVTKYPCYVAPVGGATAVHVDFVSYSSRDNSFIHHRNVYWAVKRDGIYVRDVTVGPSGDVLKYIWVPGSENS